MSSSFLENPKLSEAASFIEDALGRRMLTIILCNCKVNYEGRASSTLEYGNRLVIIKSDSSVLIHRPSGYEPVNWQPPGCIFKLEASEDEVKVRASRPQAKETLHISIKSVQHILRSNLSDEGEFALYVNELSMKRAILTSPNLIEKGFRPISSEKDLGTSGFADVFGEDSNGNFVVVEIKRTSAGKIAVIQLERYLKAVKEKVNRPIRGILVAPEIQKDAQLMLAASKLEFKALSPRKCFEILKIEKTRKISDYIDA